MQPSQLKICARQKCLVYRRIKKNQFTRGELGKGGYRATQFVLNDEAPNIFSLREVDWSLPSCQMAAVASSFVKRGCQEKTWDSFADCAAIERLK